MSDEIEHAASVLGDLARRDEPIGPRTTYRVGGRAALFVEIVDEAALERVVRATIESSVACLVLGNGSNLLVADEGFRGLCVVLGGRYGSIAVDSEAATVRAGGSMAFPVLARRCAAEGLSGMEWAVGIPGTVGGAVRMNAGGHGSSTAGRLACATVIDLATGKETERNTTALELSYRHSNVASNEIVTFAQFALDHRAIDHAQREISEIVAWRRAHQPGGRNGGSVFSNPVDDAAGRLIDAAGLKGRRVGSAEVSRKHANFILVDDQGRADDVYRLIEFVRKEVARQFGIDLSLELQTVGFPT